MSAGSGSEIAEARAVPSVSTDRWLDFACKKLEKGYVLIVSDKRKNANFYLPGSGYETCQHKAAMLLLKQGILKKTGRHHLGTVYRLADTARAAASTEPHEMPDEDDGPSSAISESEYEELLDELEAAGDDDDEADEED